MKSTNENKGKRKFIFLGLGVGILAFGGWWFLGRKKKTDEADDISLPPENKTASKPSGQKQVVKTKATPPKTTSPAPKPGSGQTKVSAFPLKSGSKNDYVKNLQQALMTKYGKGVLPKYGADGKFGKELTDTLKAKGFPAVVDETTYKKILALNAPKPAPKTTTTLTQDAKQSIAIAKFIWLYCTTKNIDKLAATLKQIKDVAQYSKVNTLFKTVKLNGKNQTIVEGTLSSFSDSDDKQTLKEQFLRIGLKYSGGKWSLGGIGEKQIYSRRATTICCPNGYSTLVPANTLLGAFVSRDKFRTKFRSLNNQVLNVSSNDIDYV